MKPVASKPRTCNSTNIRPTKSQRLEALRFKYLAIDGGDFPEGRAALHERVVNNRADDSGELQNTSGIGGSDELGVVGPNYG